MKLAYEEIDLNGIAGPTHSYAGLSPGNNAAAKNAGKPSNPREAAKQSLTLASALLQMGFPQALMPPLARPHIGFLQSIGFSGSPTEITEKAQRTDPYYLAAASSSSFMWTANAATVAPSCDTTDGRLHVGPANLGHMLHRSLEAGDTTQMLRRLLAPMIEADRAVVHNPIHFNARGQLGDEGAANHMRFTAGEHGDPGFHVFVHGNDPRDPKALSPKQNPARQQLATNEALARLLQLDPSRVMYVQQNPDFIDAGSFHNDVVAVNCTKFLLAHELAFKGEERGMASFIKTVEQRSGISLIQALIPKSEVSMEDADKSYLFNSRVKLGADGKFVIIGPENSRTTASAHKAIERIEREQQRLNPTQFYDLQQSMSNGGGPACLRLRLTMSADEMRDYPLATMLTPEIINQLMTIVDRRYRDHLTAADLADPHLIEEGQIALDEIASVFGLTNLYEFQRL